MGVECVARETLVQCLATPSEDGVLFVGVFAATNNASSPSPAQVLAQNRWFSATARTAVNASVAGLSPASNYTLYFALRSAVSGAVSSRAEILATRTSVRTDCCRSIAVSLSLSTPFVVENADTLAALTITSLPSEDYEFDVFLSLSRSGDDDDNALSAASAWVPSTLRVPRVSLSTPVSAGSTPARVFTASLSMLVAGAYRVVASVSRNALRDYRVDILGNATFAVLTAAESALLSSSQPPVLSGAEVSSDGSLIAIEFDRDTDKGNASAVFACRDLLSFRCADSAQCAWQSARVIHAVVPHRDDCVGVGDGVGLAASAAVRSLCGASSSSFDCAAWPAANTSAVVRVSAPASPASPTAVLSAPSTLGSCAALTLDATASSGHAGRAWKSVSLAVTGRDANGTAANVSSLRDLLQRTFRAFSPLVVAPEYLSAGTVYVFSLTLCNVFGACGAASKTVSVLSTLSPSVSVASAAVRAMRRAESLSLLAVASLPQCAGQSTTSSELRYAWAVKERDGDEASATTSLVSLSKNPARFSLSGFALLAERVYTVSVTVSTAVTAQSATASVEIVVLRGDVVARIANGETTRYVRAGESTALDGSLSVDEDVVESTGERAGLLFAWSCVQTAPSLNSSCLAVFDGFAEPSSEVITFVTRPSAVDRRVQMTLSVTDGARSRWSSVSLDVVVLPPLLPLLSLRSNVVPGRELSASNAVISAVVDFPAGGEGDEDAVLAWTSESMSLAALSSAALSPLSRSVPRSLSPQGQSVEFALVLPLRALRAATTWSFSLSVSTTAAVSVSAKIEISLNAPPSPGSFSVSPARSVELSQPLFSLCSGWQDADLPLSYALGVLGGRGDKLSLRSRAEIAFASLSVSAGPAASNFSVTMFADVFDALSANSSVFNTVQVLPETQTESVLLSRVNESIARLSALSTTMDVDEAKQQIVLASALLNRANCSLAPNCSALHRQPCARTSHTCGACISSAFVGDAGESNSPCVSVSTPPVSSAVSKACPANCSSRGQCAFRSLSTGAALSHCDVLSWDCVAECRCVPGYRGAACDATDDEMNARIDLREQLLRSVLSLSLREDTDRHAIAERISTVNEAALKADELSAASAAMVLSFVRDTLGAVSDNAYDPSYATGVLSTVATLADVISLRSVPSSPSAHNATTTAVAGEDVLSALQQFSRVIGSSMAAGQFPANWQFDAFRVDAHTLSATTATNGSDSCVERDSAALAATAREKALGVSPASFSLPICRSDASFAAFISLSAALFNVSQGMLMADPVSLQMPSLPCGGEGDGDASSCAVTLSMPWIGPPLHENDEDAETLNVTCAAGFVGALTHRCESGFNATIACNGTQSVVRVACPARRSAPTCALLDGSSAVDNGCMVLSFSNNTVRCSCPLDSLHSAIRRALQSSSNATGAATVSVTYTAMLQSTMSTFATTVLSASQLDASVLESSWQVIATLGGLLGAVLCGMCVGFRLDRAEHVEKMAKKRSTVLATRTHRSIVVSPHTPSSSKQPMILAMLEESLPLFLRSESLMEKTKTAFRQHHRWFQVYFVYSTKLSRTLRVYSLANNVIIMMFVQSILYNLSQGDNGTCAGLDAETTCLQQQSMYRAGSSECYWDAAAAQCRYLQPSDSLKVMLFVAGLSAALSTPLAMLADWLVVNVLGAPVHYGALFGARARRTAPAALEDVLFANRSSLVQRRQHAAVQPLPQESGVQSGGIAVVDAQSAVQELQASLREYRSRLAEEDRRQFDESWGLDSEGKFRVSTASSDTQSTWYLSAVLGSRSAERSADVATAVRQDIEKAFAAARTECAGFAAPNISDREKNQRVLFHFQRDLLVGLGEEALQAQDRRAYLRRTPRHVWVHRGAWAFLAAMDAGMLFYMFLFGVSKDGPHQRAWAQSFAMWLLMEIVFFASLVALISNVFAPMLLVRNASALKRRTVAALVECNRALRRQDVPAVEERLHEEEQPVHAEKKGKPMDEEEPLNAAKYLFVSHLVAQRNPHLHASKAVLAFSTPWPRESYAARGRADVSDALSETTDTLVAVSVFLLTTFLKMPNQSQDVLVQTAIVMVCTYVAQWHLALYAVHPALVAVPALMLTLLGHFSWMLIRFRREQELVQVAAQMREKEKEEKEKDDAQLLVLRRDNAAVSAASALAVPATIAQHATRRQSLVAGLRLLERQRDAASASRERESVDEEKSSAVAASSSSASVSEDCRETGSDVSHEDFQSFDDSLSDDGDDD